MPKYKVLVGITLIISFSFIASGCEDILPWSASPDENDTAREEDGLPEWLSMTHRSTDGFRIDHEDEDFESDEVTDADIIPGKEDAEEIEDVTSDDGEDKVTDDPSTEKEETTEPTETAEPAEEEITDDKPKPGTMDYIVWKRQQEKNDEKGPGVFDRENPWWEKEVQDSFDHHVIERSN